MRGVILGALALCLGTAAAAQDVLTNDMVVALVGAGLGEQTIVAKIKASANSFDVSGDKLIALKRQGLSDAVIAAMIDASSKAQVSSAAAMNSESPDPRTPHASGIYMLADWEQPARMVRMDATTSNQTKTGGFLGYALTAGIAKIKINTVLPGAHARVTTALLRPKFYFYFDQATSSLSNGAPGGFWVQGAGAAVTSPNEFSMVRFDVKKDRREAAIGQFSIVGAKAGVQDKQRVAMRYTDIRPGVFEVTPQADLAPGEYGFVYSSTTGGGVGMYGGGATLSRVFDFSIAPSPVGNAQRAGT
jgi:hypothetical protein